MTSSNKATPPQKKHFKQVSVSSQVVLDTEYLDSHEQSRITEMAVQDALALANAKIEQMLDEAREEAARIIAEAERHIEVEINQKRDTLLQNFMEEGLQMARAQMALDMEKAARLVHEAYQFQQRLVDTYHEDLALFLSGIAQAVFKAELMLKPEHLSPLILAAKSRLPASGLIKLVINPQTYHRLETALPGWAETHGFLIQTDGTCGLEQLYVSVADTAYDISPATQGQRYMEAALAHLRLPNGILQNLMNSCHEQGDEEELPLAENMFLTAQGGSLLENAEQQEIIASAMADTQAASIETGSSILEIAQQQQAMIQPNLVDAADAVVMEAAALLNELAPEEGEPHAD